MHEVTDTTVSPPSAFAQLGAFLLDAGYAVTDVDFALYKVAEKAGYPDMAFVVLPATVFASDHPGDATTVVNATGVELPLLITARANLLVRRLLAGKVPFWRIPEHIAKVRASTAHITWWELLLGSSGLAGGLGVLFRIPWWAVIATFVLGALIGVAIHLGSKVRGAGTIITFLVAFGTTLSVGLLASHFELGPIPLFAVCAPLAVLVPGTTITNALLELSATDMITGSSRLMYGLLVLAFMTVGIGAAAMATGLRIDASAAHLLGDVTRVSTDMAGISALPPLWFSWIGVVVMAAGIGLAFKAGWRLTLLSIPAMLLTYAGIMVLTPHIGSIGATGVVGAVFFFFARVVERFEPRAPAIVTFRPAFILLVPGIVGLVALTTFDNQTVVTALGTFLSLSIGTKGGAVVADLIFRHEPNAEEPFNDMAA
jgi:uncharacterized membrane protein YjjP (DUF1212 family)